MFPELQANLDAHRRAPSDETRAALSSSLIASYTALPREGSYGRIGDRALQSRDFKSFVEGFVSALSGPILDDAAAVFDAFRNLANFRCGTGFQAGEELPKDTWRAHHAVPTSIISKALATHFLPLITKAVKQLVKRGLRHFDPDELFSFGADGLLQSIERFDCELNVRFSTYAAPRIRGSIIDSIREHDPLSRTARKDVQIIDKAFEEYAALHGGLPDESELARLLDLEPKKIQKMLESHLNSRTLSLNFDSGEEGGRRFNTDIHDRRAIDPLEYVTLKDLLEQLVSKLPVKDRLILILIYHEEFTLKQVGYALDLSESRISQRHKQILERLREVLAEYEKLLAGATSRYRESMRVYEELVRAD